MFDRVEEDRANYPYLEFGNIEDLIFNNNYWVLFPVSIKKIMYFTGNTSSYIKIKENRFKVTNINNNATAIDASSLVENPNILVESNILSGFR